MNGLNATPYVVFVKENDMASCKDCIHEKLCVIKAFPDAFENTRWEKEPCDHFKPKTEWISVSERLPDEELQELRSNDPEMTFRCLTARMSEDNHGETYVYQAFYDEKRGKKRFVNENGVDITASVTHWRPLPEPPKMKGVSHD